MSSVFLKKSLLAIVSIILVGAVFFAAAPASAVDLIVNIPAPGGAADVGKVTNFCEYVKTWYNFFLGIVGILAVFMIVIGGVQWLFAAGNSSKIGKAKETIVAAVLGMLLAFVSFGILYIINPDLVQCEKLKITDITLKKEEEATASPSTVPQVTLGVGEVRVLGTKTGKQDAIFKTSFICEQDESGTKINKVFPGVIEVPIDVGVIKAGSTKYTHISFGPGDIGFEFKISRSRDCVSLKPPVGLFIHVITDGFTQYNIGEGCTVVSTGTLTEADVQLNGKLFNAMIEEKGGVPQSSKCDFNTDTLKETVPKG